jgi:hypothetical protein
MKLTVEQIEVRVWATVVISMVAILVICAVSMVLSIAFVPQEETLKPVDAKFLEITEKIILMIISGLAGFLGRSYIHKAAEKIAGEENG